MPILTLYGVPEILNPKELQNLRDMLRETTADALGIVPDTVIVFFPRDLRPFGMGEELILFIDGVSPRPSQHPEGLEIMAKILTNRLFDFCQQRFDSSFRLVQVLNRRFDPAIDVCNSYPRMV